MSVRKYTRKHDGAVVYVGCFYESGGRRVVRKVRTVRKDAPQKDHERARIAALKWSHDQKIDVENGVWTDPKGERGARLTVQTLIGRFLRLYKSKAGQVKYYQDRAKVWERLLPVKKPAERLCTEDIDKFKHDREAEGVGGRHDLIALGTMLRWALARKYISSNPADSRLVQRPAKPRPDPRPLSDVEVVALLDALDQDYADVVEFMLETGADLSEVLTLSWTRHVDQDAKLIRLPRAKTGVGRALPYGGNTRLQAILDRAALGATGKYAAGRVFLRSGEPIIAKTIRSAMVRARRRAGVTKPRPWKSLRATFATRKTLEGWDVPTVAALMGLTTAHVLESYVLPTGKHLEAAMSDPKKAVIDGTRQRTTIPEGP